MMAERDELIEQLRQLTDKLETEGFVVRGQNQQTDKLSERNAQLQERTEEFREIVTMKDQVYFDIPDAVFRCLVSGA